MRPFYYIVVVCLTCLLTLHSAPPVTCDGTLAMDVKCLNGVLPDSTTQFEAAWCEDGNSTSAHVACKNAVAFNVTAFGCTQPAATGTPPMYTTYCIDSAASYECYRRKTCSYLWGERNGVLYTICYQVGTTYINYRAPKGNLRDTNDPPANCTPDAPPNPQ